MKYTLLDWQRALAQAPAIDVVAFAAARDGHGFILTAWCAGARFVARLPDLLEDSIRLHDAFTTHRYALVRGTVGVAPEVAIERLVAAVQRLAAAA